MARLEETLGMSSADKRSKWDTLRNGLELLNEKQNDNNIDDNSNNRVNNENGLKINISSSNADETCESKWGIFDKLGFFDTVKKTAKNFSNLEIMKETEASQQQQQQQQQPQTSVSKHGIKNEVEGVNEVIEDEASSTEEGKSKSDEAVTNKLLSKCLDVWNSSLNAHPSSPTHSSSSFTSPFKSSPISNAKNVDAFALYVSEQLNDLSSSDRLLAEKRINDVLFQLRYEALMHKSSNKSDIIED